MKKIIFLSGIFLFARAAFAQSTINTDKNSVSSAKKLDVTETTATLEREIEGGKEIVSVAFPFVAGASEGLAEPKIPNMRGIMSARTKPLMVVEPIEVPQLTKLISYDKPVSRTAVKMIAADDAGKLFEMLRDEKKII